MCSNLNVMARVVGKAISGGVPVLIDEISAIYLTTTPATSRNRERRHFLFFFQTQLTVVNAELRPTKTRRTDIGTSILDRRINPVVQTGSLTDFRFRAEDRTCF